MDYFPLFKDEVNYLSVLPFYWSLYLFYMTAFIVYIIFFSQLEDRGYA